MRLLKLLVTAIDYIAMFIALPAFTILAVAIVVFALRGAFLGVSSGIHDMWAAHDDRILLYVIAVATAWCGIRKKALNTRPK